jgi:hypothetical protein
VRQTVVLLNDMTIREAVPLSRIFFPNWDFLQDFLKIPIISPEGSANAMSEAEGAQRPVFRVNESEKGGRAAQGRVANCCTIRLTL